MSVGGSNFTDRIEEAKRIKLDFENGVNVILISPRRMGKTSLIKKVISEVDNPMIKIVYMDIYDCRSEYDFYNRFAETIMRSTGNHAEQVIENIKRFLVRVSPKLSFSPEPNSEFSVSLGITPKNYSPEEILNLPERIAQEQGVRMVVCIDEFQQIGEFTDSLTIQKRLRGAWQHHQNSPTSPLVAVNRTSWPFNGTTVLMSEFPILCFHSTLPVFPSSAKISPSLVLPNITPSFSTCMEGACS